MLTTRDEALLYPSEADRVEAWRLKELVTAGYPIVVAEKIAARLDIDLHRAVDLITTGGCPLELAVAILL